MHEGTSEEIFQISEAALKSKHGILKEVQLFQNLQSYTGMHHKVVDMNRPVRTKHQGIARRYERRDDMSVQDSIDNGTLVQELKGKDTYFSLSVTNKAMPVSDKGISEIDSEGTHRDAGVTFMSDWRGSAVEVATLMGFDTLMKAEERERVTQGESSIVFGDGDPQLNYPPPQYSFL